MSKKYIWLVTIVLAISLCGMIFIQIKYYQSTAKIKEEQFVLTVSKALDQVVEKMDSDDEAKGILEGNTQTDPKITSTRTINGSRFDIELPQQPSQHSSKASNYREEKVLFKGTKIDARSLNELLKKQAATRSRFLSNSYQFETYRLARETMPLKERVDLNTIQKLIKEKLINNGIKLDFEYAVKSENKFEKNQQIILQKQEKKLIQSSYFRMIPTETHMSY